MTRLKFTSVLLEIICLLFILLFVYAAASKLMEYPDFHAQLTQSPLLLKFVDIVAWLVPTVEIIVAILLSVDRYRNIGLYASFSIMIIFTLYIIAITQLSEKVPCSCGGILQRMSWNQHLIFNIAFVFFAVLGILLENKLKQESRTTEFLLQ